VKAPALGEAATHLPWLLPGAASLVALARSPAAAAWLAVRTDPAAALLVVRQTAAKLALPSSSYFPALLHDPAILEAAARLVDHPEGWVDWDQPVVAPVYEASVTYARLASFLAERTGGCDSENAWVAGLLAPLGWQAVCAADPDRVAACLQDPGLKSDPVGLQQQLWGFDQASIARRLARRWQLPRWLAVAIGHLDLPAETAVAIGADEPLFRVTQLAVALAQRQGIDLNLTVCTSVEEGAAALKVDAVLLEAAGRELGRLRDEQPARPRGSAPSGVPLLRDLLLAAAENRRLHDASVLETLEADVDQLHCSLCEQRGGEAQRLKGQKLTALAEFAAGAGHEINNPLAVISGQAQYLLNHEPEPARQRALQTIIGQAHRIHQILNGLMQFARPPGPQKQMLDVPGLVREVAASLDELAAQRRVRVSCPQPDYPLSLYADPAQVATALAGLLRNAIEAAPADGWAEVRLETPAPDRLDLVVEDNGGGPTAAQREHLFDPFYSGRTAGRGRGLGLSTAWRLAREHGGDVTFVPLPGGPTRFVLSLPRESAHLGNGANGQPHANGDDLLPLVTQQ
jgi:signal transduction histidine kinase